jgi:hypothetical protein
MEGKEQAQAGGMSHALSMGPQTSYAANSGRLLLHTLLAAHKFNALSFAVHIPCDIQFFAKKIRSLVCSLSVGSTRRVHINETNVESNFLRKSKCFP